MKRIALFFLILSTAVCARNEDEVLLAGYFVPLKYVGPVINEKMSPHDAQERCKETPLDLVILINMKVKEEWGGIAWGTLSVRKFKDHNYTYHVDVSSFDITGSWMMLSIKNSYVSDEHMKEGPYVKWHRLKSK